MIPVKTGPDGFSLRSGLGGLPLEFAGRRPAWPRAVALQAINLFRFFVRGETCVDRGG